MRGGKKKRRFKMKKEEITKNYNLWIKTKNLKYWSNVINLIKGGLK